MSKIKNGEIYYCLVGRGIVKFGSCVGIKWVQHYDNSSDEMISLAGVCGYKHESELMGKEEAIATALTQLEEWTKEAERDYDEALEHITKLHDRLKRIK